MIYKLKRLRSGKSIDQDGKAVDRGVWNNIPRYDYCAVTIVPELGRDGYPVTGLTDKDARRLETKLFMRDGELDRRSVYWTEGSGEGSDKKPFSIPFPPTGLILNDQDPEDELKLLVLQAQKKVANGLADEKKKSKAQFILTSDQLIETEEDDRLSIKENAYKLLSESSDDQLKQQYVVLLSVKSKGSQITDVSSMTPKAIKNGLRMTIEASPNTYIKIAEDPKLKLKSEILNLVTKRVLSTSNGTYSFGPDQIASDLDEAVAYMENPHNQGQVIKFKQLASKKNKD